MAVGSSSGPQRAIITLPEFLTQEHLVRATLANTRHLNRVIDYKHKGKTYALRVINNIDGISIEGFFHSKSPYIFSCKEQIPSSLFNELNDLTHTKNALFLNCLIGDEHIFDLLDQPS